MTEAINARVAHQAQERKFEPAKLGFVFTTAEIDREIDRRSMQRNPRHPSGEPRKIPTHADFAKFVGLSLNPNC